VPCPCPIVGDGCFLGKTILSRALLEVKHLSKDYFFYLFIHPFIFSFDIRKISFLLLEKKKRKTEVRHFGN
jgi:hypothetical protein